MDNYIHTQIVLLVKQRLGDEFTELLDKDEHYKRLTSERATICQRLTQGDVAALAQYLELDEEIMEIETHHAYLLGVSEYDLFQKIRRTMDSSDWNELVATCTKQFGSELEEDYSLSLGGVSRHQQLKKIPLLIAALGMVICLLTGACLPKLFQIITEGDTFTRVASGSMELPDTTGDSTFHSLEEALEHYGLENVAPAWIPENYTLDSVGTNDNDGYSSIYAWYVSKSDTQEGISIRIVCYQQAESMVEKYEMEVEGGEERFANGVQYFVTQNKQNIRAVWMSGNCLCSISGPVSDSDLNQMVKSTTW